MRRRASAAARDARADGSAEYLELPGSVPLGAVRYARYEEVEGRLEPGATLLLYTDGIVERPGEPLDEGLARLRDAVAGRDLDASGDVRRGPGRDAPGGLGQ